MNSRILIVIIFVCFSLGKVFSKTLENECIKRTIHCIYIVDSNDSRLDVIKNNMSNDIEHELNNMQTSLKASVSKYYITGDKFNSESCYKLISDINISPLSDIVMIVVLAHGNQSTKGGPYPDIKFTDNDSRYFADIMDLILAKQPSHLFSIVNSCNHLSGEKTEGDRLYDSFKNCNKTTGTLSKEAYQHLYRPRNFTMAITFLAAQKGTAIWVDEKGGTPFKSLIQALKHCTSDKWPNQDLVTWSDIMLTAEILNVCNTHIDDRKECPYAELVKVEFDNQEISLDGEAIIFCK